MSDALSASAEFDGSTSSLKSRHVGKVGHPGSSRRSKSRRRNGSRRKEQRSLLFRFNEWAYNRDGVFKLVSAALLSIKLAAFVLWLFPYNYVLKRRVLHTVLNLTVTKLFIRSLPLQAVFYLINYVQGARTYSLIRDRLGLLGKGSLPSSVIMAEEEGDGEGEGEGQGEGGGGGGGSGRDDGTVPTIRAGRVEVSSSNLIVTTTPGGATGAANTSTSRNLLRLVSGGKRAVDKSHVSLLGLLLCLFTRRSWYLADNNEDALFALEAGALERDIVAFRPPPVRLVSLATSIYKRVMDPVFLGLENVPAVSEIDRPIIFVANHTLLALELPLLLEGLYRRKGIFLRGIADHAHFQIPINDVVLRSFFGCVDGTQRNVEVLARAGQCMLVYPGGAREVFKRSTDHKYDLFWSGKLGFARAAVRHGCTVIPVTNVGTEDMADVVYDLPLGWLPLPFLRGRADMSLPVMRPGKLQRCYFRFGEPIRTDQYRGDFGPGERNVKRVRSLAERAMRQNLDFLFRFRREDPERFANLEATRTNAQALADFVRGRRWGNGGGGEAEGDDALKDEAGKGLEAMRSGSRFSNLSLAGGGEGGGDDDEDEEDEGKKRSGNASGEGEGDDDDDDDDDDDNDGGDDSVWGVPISPFNDDGGAGSKL